MAPTGNFAGTPTCGARALHVLTADTPDTSSGCDRAGGRAENFEVGKLVETFGVGGEDIVFSGGFAQDREHATDFAAEAAEKVNVSVDPKTGNPAFRSED